MSPALLSLAAFSIMLYTHVSGKTVAKKISWIFQQRTKKSSSDFYSDGGEKNCPKHKPQIKVWWGPNYGRFHFLDMYIHQTNQYRTTHNQIHSPWVLELTFTPLGESHLHLSWRNPRSSQPADIFWCQPTNFSIGSEESVFMYCT